MVVRKNNWFYFAMISNLLWVMIIGVYAGGKIVKKYVKAAPVNHWAESHYRERRDLFQTANLLNNKKIDVVFLGDSITERGLFHEFLPELRIINRGIGSDTTEGVIKRLDDLKGIAARKIFIMIGINDISQKIPNDTIIKNYVSILAQLKKAHASSKIYVVSVLPTLGADNTNVPQFNESIKQMCSAQNITFVDAWSSFRTEQNRTEQNRTEQNRTEQNRTEQNNPLFNADGVHLTGEGYQLLLRCYKTYLEE